MMVITRWLITIRNATIIRRCLKHVNKFILGLDLKERSVRHYEIHVKSVDSLRWICVHRAALIVPISAPLREVSKAPLSE
jgi:hypothetical protein